MRILILEDDPLIALDLESAVEGAGHLPVGPFATIRAAAAAIGAARPGFALLDIDLPDGKSFDLAVRLLAEGIPFAFVSGSRVSDLPAHLRQARFVPKPFSHDALLRVLPVPTQLAS